MWLEIGNVELNYRKAFPEEIPPAYGKKGKGGRSSRTVLREAACPACCEGRHMQKEIRNLFGIQDVIIYSIVRGMEQAKRGGLILDSWSRE